MLINFKFTDPHPMFDYMQTAGPVKYTDTRLVGNKWYFDCHAVLVLPKYLIPPSLPEFESRLTVFLPDVEKGDVLLYLTYCYTGSVPVNVDDEEGFLGLIKMLWPAASFVSLTSLEGGPSRTCTPSPSSSLVNLFNSRGDSPANSQCLRQLSMSPKEVLEENTKMVKGMVKTSYNKGCEFNTEDIVECVNEDHAGDNGRSEKEIKHVEQPIKCSKPKRARILMPQKKHHSLPEPDNLKCDICHKIIKFKKNLIRHNRLFHSDNLIETLQCLTCSVMFSSKYHLERHLASKNCLNNLSHECKDCKAKFVSQEKLKVHGSKNCLKKYFCSICFMFFKSKKIFENHNNSHHSVVERS